MANFLKSTTDFVGSTGQQGLDGLQSGGKFVAGSAQQGVSGVGKGLNSGFNTVTGAFSPGTEKKEGEAQQQLQPAGTTHEAPRERQNVFNTVGGGIQSGFQGAGNFLSTGASATGDALTAGVGMVGEVTKSGLQIGETVAKAGLDLTGSVVVGTVGLAGTAVGGVVDLAAETSGAVFEPVTAGLRSIEGLQGLANSGLETINGLPMAAVKQVGALTLKAMNMSGITPTFFDPDADGVVRVEDTVKGLLVLGLTEKNASYAAYALHAAFSYSTGESWVPARDATLPIKVKNLGRTRWGKKWKKTLTQGRQGFGALLLIFEWGTTWPFLMPPVPAADIPFKDEIGKVVRTVLLPTILRNWKRSHGVPANEGESKDKEEGKA
ncbi:hypothetical protein FB451DRAFT_1266935 [Mycena latifolia]|nr:hypothetical protein FB451DRAFT_1266935 [Mycena latifolia]